MNAGCVEQIGPPEIIYCCPATPFVARFLGLTNLAEGKITAPGRIASAWGEIRAETTDHQPGDRVSVLIRPEAAKLMTSHQSTGSGTIIRGQLLSRSFRGGRYRVQVQPETGPPLSFELASTGALPIGPGDQMTIGLDPNGIALLPATD